MKDFKKYLEIIQEMEENKTPCSNFCSKNIFK